MNCENACRVAVEQHWSDAALAVLTHHLDIRSPMRNTYIHNIADLEGLFKGITATLMFSWVAVSHGFLLCILVVSEHLNS